MKRAATILAVIAALVTATAASAATSSDPSPAQNAYPLTITVQSPVKGGGENVPYVITVTNHSDHLRIAPIVYLDYFAVPAAGNAHLIYAYDRMFNQNIRAWFVGTLAPGQSRTLALWYQPTVTFPPYTDPFSGTTYTSPSAAIGQDYYPIFWLYDNYYKLYTSAMPATPLFVGGK